MTRDLKRRLQRLETLYPAPPEPSEFQVLLPFMTLHERFRLLKQFQLGQYEAFQRDAQIILERAKDRQDRGLTWWDDAELNKAERAKDDRLWHLVRAIQSRHPGFYPGTNRFDVLDLSSDEIDQLTDFVKRASVPEDLANALQLIEKLRIDGCPVTLDGFAAIVFEARLGEEPKIIWRYLP
jgi:hypothetical protein